MVASGVPDKLRHEHVREIAYTALKQRQVSEDGAQTFQEINSKVLKTVFIC